MFFLMLPKDFVEAKGESLQVVEEMHKNMTKLFNELVEYYSLDPKKANFEDFFGLLNNFIKEYTVILDWWFAFILFLKNIHCKINIRLDIVNSDYLARIALVFLLLQPFTKYLRLTLVSMWNSALRGKFNLCFSRVFC